ncbi:DEAD/DEAH box helicase [Ferirhizobium litorale]|uniref:DNA 3'-5' helicase II n=1 Tax=Ferirhizobium litorale TaxID=2927786 RepID=A0AAE3QC80_9HYPH|nr:ATP-binding domain-containing protein [Fererhizobium litorale]MDI7920703.1 ATP-binding domain-containing protein [Fererhizobium litorale]
MVNTIWGTTKKPVSSQRLATLFEERIKDDGYLFIGYPVIATPEGPYAMDALWVSPIHGLVIFNLVEGRDAGIFEEAEAESANTLETKLRNHKSLMNGRKLLAEPNVVTYAPIAPASEGLCVSDDELVTRVENFTWDYPESYADALSIIQSISTIRRSRRGRTVEKEGSRGAKLKELEASIANLDNLQGRAVIETVEGVQRIRGLAGSGKTIVLALKAAYLHSQHPDWKIAITFNTRSLKEQFRRLVTTFTFEQTGEEPDWENLQVLNAWGAPGGADKSGLYYLYCQAHGIEFFDFQSAKSRFRSGREFEGACDYALSQAKGRRALYDVILVDEAQDFAPAFLNLCYDMLRPPHRLVYAYDELQTLNEKSLPSPEEIFGVDANGRPRVQFRGHAPNAPQQDIILEKCYRNSRPVLATAHALGFGIYRPADPKTGTGLIQMFERNELWRDVGYTVVDGALEDGKRVRLARTDNTSPLFLENHSDIDDLIQFHSFADKEAQADWVANEIAKNLTTDELGFEDIIVINPNPLSTRNEAGIVRRKLFDKGINSHLAGVDTSPDVFFNVENKTVAFTGIFRAKGNEAGMVYILNAQDCRASFGSLARVRNQLFTAITRSKAWVRVLGIGPNMDALKDEFSAVKNADFELEFLYPDADTRKHMNIINRDMTDEEKQKVKSSSRTLKDLVDDLQAGRVLMEDLPEDDLERLRNILERGANAARQ